MPLTSYRELRVWKEAMELAAAIYRLSAAFPDSERFGLTAQLRRAAVAVPSDIAEGYARFTRPDYLRFLGMARGSLAEIETQLILAIQLDLAPSASVRAVLTRAESVGRMLTRLTLSLTRPHPRPSPQPPAPRPEQYAVPTPPRTAPSHPAPPTSPPA